LNTLTQVTTLQPQCCWHTEQISRHDCPNFRDGDEALLFDRKQRFLLRCINCHLFLEDLRSLGPEAGDLPQLFPFAIEELVKLRAQTQEQQGRVENLERQGRFLREVGQELQSSLDRDAVISMALTAVTAGEGFDLNRAILLLVDHRNQSLVGYLAIGPRDHEEAGQIWQEIEQRNFSLREMAQRLKTEKFTSERAKFKDLLETLSTPLQRTDHIFVQTLDSHLSRHIPDLSREPGIDPEQVAALGVRELILAPLISEGRRIGLLLADNLINYRPLGPRDQQALETFAAPVAYAIERAELHERLQLELERTTNANQRLKEQQLQILQMEKMALVGRVTADVAHSIRNPLTIIGGYARSLAKIMPEGAAQRSAIDSIVRETRRLEDALEEVLLYSEARHPTLDNWDINRILHGVYAGIQDDLNATEATVTLDLAPALSLARVDFKRLGHCLRSILKQLLHAATPGSRISISTRQEERRILLSFSGTNLVPEALPTPGSATPDGSGNSTSLGLALCARILEGQNAELAIQTEPTGTVRMTIAIAPNEERQHEPVTDC
jgi:signal transduction histidine kinase